jgi:hypothetical protein
MPVYLKIVLLCLLCVAVIFAIVLVLKWFW